ncbi:hypothetical protein, partial [Escherichia coli]|uniref:hypothetical protein n=1 Tax=Escherichia coli TaxID=562 RepID=UPI001BDC02A8
TKPEDLGIPFLTILQKGSPEVDDTNPDHARKTFPGCKGGLIINTLQRKIVYDGFTPCQFVPSAYVKLFQEWKPRNQG